MIRLDQRWWSIIFDFVLEMMKVIDVFVVDTEIIDEGGEGYRSCFVLGY